MNGWNPRENLRHGIPYYGSTRLEKIPKVGEGGSDPVPGKFMVVVSCSESQGIVEVADVDGDGVAFDGFGNLEATPISSSGTFAYNGVEDWHTVGDVVAVQPFAGTLGSHYLSWNVVPHVRGIGRYTFPGSGFASVQWNPAARTSCSGLTG